MLTLIFRSNMLHMEQAPELILSSKTADLKSGIKTEICSILFLSNLRLIITGLYAIKTGLTSLSKSLQNKALIIQRRRVARRKTLKNEI